MKMKKIVPVIVKSEHAKCERCKKVIKKGEIGHLVISQSPISDELEDKDIFHKDCLDVCLSEYDFISILEGNDHDED